jgi:hypothetical protein
MTCAISYALTVFLHERPFNSARDIYWQESALLAIEIAEGGREKKEIGMSD